VAGPLVDYLCRFKDFHVTVASNRLTEAETLTRKHSNARAIELLDLRALDHLVKDADVVVRQVSS
jgi:saccharopine dehydrogenase-like NADP-dependent oxidoreductase